MPPTQNAAAQTPAVEPTTSASGGVAAVAALPGTRIDPAHPVAAASPSWTARQSVAAGQSVAEIQAGDAALADSPVLIEAQAAQLAGLLDARQQELDQREAQLDRREAALAQEVREARFRLIQRRRQIDQRQTARQHVLQRQSKRLDRRRAAVDESRHQAAQMRQEALELMLASEQLHAQLVGSVGQAELAKSLDRLRQRLADHYREEAQELTRRRAELELLKVELAEQYEKLLGQMAQDKRHDESL